MLSPMHHTKLNILIYWRNELQNANMGFLLAFEVVWRNKYSVEIQWTLQEKYNLVE